MAGIRTRDPYPPLPRFLRVHSIPSGRRRQLEPGGIFRLEATTQRRDDLWRELNTQLERTSQPNSRRGEWQLRAWLHPLPIVRDASRQMTFTRSVRGDVSGAGSSGGPLAAPLLRHYSEVTEGFFFFCGGYGRRILAGIYCAVHILYLYTGGRRFGISCFIIALWRNSLSADARPRPGSSHILTAESKAKDWNSNVGRLQSRLSAAPTRHRAQLRLPIKLIDISARTAEPHVCYLDATESGKGLSYSKHTDVHRPHGPDVFHTHGCLVAPPPAPFTQCLRLPLVPPVSYPSPDRSITGYGVWTITYCFPPPSPHLRQCQVSCFPSRMRDSSRPESLIWMS